MTQTENVSTALLWELTKKHNSFLRRSRNTTFSLDHYNVTYRHTKKNSGFIKTKAINFGMVKNKPQLVAISQDEKGAIKFEKKLESSKTAVFNFLEEHAKNRKLKNRLKAKFRRIHKFDHGAKN